MTKKIIIIGGGPVGCYMAQVLKLYGFNPLIIEEHNEIGKPVHCTGVIGSRLFTDKRPYSVPSSSIINVINGAVIHYDTQHFILERKNVAYVIDREKFDKELSKGLDILYHNKFLGLEVTDSHYIVETEEDEIAADIIIGADGANSTVRKILGQDLNIKSYRGVQLRIQVKPRHKDFVEIFLRRPSFFWVVPESEDIVRIGTISQNPYKELDIFLKEEKIKGKVIEKFGGLVSIGICNNTVKNKIALVGDAACQVKPLTYGGVYFGLKSASILANCIKENRVQDYDALWKKQLSFEIKAGLRLKEIYGRLDKAEISKIFRLLKNEKALIEKVGDFENHGRMMLEVLKKPRLYPQIGNLFSALFDKIL